MHNILVYVCVCVYVNIYIQTDRGMSLCDIGHQCPICHWVFSLFLHLVYFSRAKWISSKDLLYIIEPVVKRVGVKRVGLTLSILSTHMQSHWRKRGGAGSTEFNHVSFRAFCLEKIYFCHDYSSFLFSSL